MTGFANGIFDRLLMPSGGFCALLTLTVLLVYSNEFQSLNPSKIVSDRFKHTDKTARACSTCFCK
ncbi:hypothetical protein [Nostoc flagelliforme]